MSGTARLRAVVGAVSISVESDVPVAADRYMTWGTSGLALSLDSGSPGLLPLAEARATVFRESPPRLVGALGICGRNGRVLAKSSRNLPIPSVSADGTRSAPRLCTGSIDATRRLPSE
jgi:hypothetical protein